MSVAEWDNEYARLARAASQNRTQGLSSPADANALAQGLNRLDTALNSLPLTPNEVQRRRRLISHLKSGGSGGVDPLSGGGGSGGYIPPGGGAGQQTQMSLAMQQQDAMIDELAIGVGRLKDQTQMIGDEAKMHVNLLNDMENNLGAAQDGLEAETRRAAQLKEDQSVWRLQLTVAGLSVLLVLLILMGLS